MYMEKLIDYHLNKYPKIITGWAFLFVWRFGKKKKKQELGINLF